MSRKDKIPVLDKAAEIGTVFCLLCVCVCVGSKTDLKDSVFALSCIIESLSNLEGININLFLWQGSLQGCTAWGRTRQDPLRVKIFSIIGKVAKRCFARFDLRALESLGFILGAVIKQNFTPSSKSSALRYIHTPDCFTAAQKTTAVSVSCLETRKVGFGLYEVYYTDFVGVITLSRDSFVNTTLLGYCRNLYHSLQTEYEFLEELLNHFSVKCGKEILQSFRFWS